MSSTKYSSADGSQDEFLISEGGSIFDENDMVEIPLSIETVFTGHVFSVDRVDVLLQDGKKAPREIVRHNGGAAIVPMDDQGNIYMVRQFRSPFDKVLLEIPAGKLEPNEDPELCAIRELEEETGLKSSHIESLGTIYPSPGYCAETLYLYLATHLTHGNANPDDGEFLNVHRIPLRILMQKIDSGEISDAKTIVALLKTARRLGI